MTSVLANSCLKSWYAVPSLAGAGSSVSHPMPVILLCLTILLQAHACQNPCSAWLCGLCLHVVGAWRALCMQKHACQSFSGDRNRQIEGVENLGFKVDWSQLL